MAGTERGGGGDHSGASVGRHPGIDRTIEDRVRRAAALGGLTTWLVVASISFGIWQSWWLASIFLTGTFMVIVLVPDGEDQPDIEETGGPKGPEPTRYGDWENKGRAIDF